MPLLTPELEAKIGSIVTYTAPEPFGSAAARYFATAIGDSNPLYSDPAYARGCGLRDVAIPPTLVAETNQYTNLPISEDGNTGHDWGLDVPGTRQVRGSNLYRFHRRIQADDVVTVRYELTGIDEKTNRTGAEMLIFKTTMTVVNQEDELLLENEETVILIDLGGRQ